MMMGGSTIKSFLSKGKQTGKLELQNKKLSKFPEDICKFNDLLIDDSKDSSLKEINLSGNSIPKILDEFASNN